MKVYVNSRGGGGVSVGPGCAVFLVLLSLPFRAAWALLVAIVRWLNR